MAVRRPSTVRALFVDLATEAGAQDPAALAQQLIVLYDGGGISAWMDHDPTVAATTRAIAQLLDDAAIPPPKTHSAKPASRRAVATPRQSGRGRG
jgi:hypothetical protein